MAEIIGITSGVLALTEFAIQTSVTLYQTVQSFQSHSQRIRDLSDEIHALSGVLEHLSQTTKALTDVDFSALKLPLLRCGNACKDFEALLQKCSSHSTKDRTSFRDWAKLRYMGEDIDYFRRLLSSYKMTVSVALTDANLRTTATTAEDIRSYSNLLVTTQTDLEERLLLMNDKLDLIGDTVVKSQRDAAEVKLIKEERTSIEACLKVCAQLSEHISEVQVATGYNASGPGRGDGISPEQITGEGLQQCKTNLARVIEALRSREKALFNRLLERTKVATTSQDERDDLVRLREEWEAVNQSVDICAQANDHLRASISTIDNYATGDAVQFMVSTNGKTIQGRNHGVGWRSRQVGGHIDPASLQQLMRSMEVLNVPAAIHTSMPDPPENGQASSSGDPGSNGSSFQGKGISLASMPPRTKN